MNLDKTIKELSNRLDEVSPAPTTTNDGISNNGISYWKGKKIISIKDWKELYEKSSIYTDAYKITLTSRIPLQYFPDDYNGSISVIGLKDEKLKEEIQNWNTDYYELLEYRKNPTLGKKKCSKCLLNGSSEDPIFVGIEKVFARIVMKHCNSNGTVNDYSQSPNITYYCYVMNIFSCPMESIKFYNENEKEIEESKYPYKREDLFTLHQISFAIEQAITTFFEITKNNEIIYDVDFLNDRVQEIHTKYNREPESWGGNDNVKEQLSKVKPISNIIIRNELDIYDILTNREKLECLLQEYEKKINHQLSKEEDEELENENLKPELKAKMKEELKKHKEEQLILLKDNKQNIIDFIVYNKDAVRAEDLKIYEPVYKCYRDKGNCHICKSTTNIVCKNCNDYNKEIWLCTNHWQEHAIEKHTQLIW